ncbi:MAG: Organic hydroperoxide resistance protein [uncultured Thermomicrobiales bacterium]|uniref:Organic hydroperoxide resistance protein n=1 Tax=uncultured Thermomicrobiales bacterium TaxID=1645740 RepID=A0A6J4VIK6_9BACT|nr:MAG: Organic hydroperoxide resistance protein [uncultured Thermomicrobiales bacterium]
MIRSIIEPIYTTTATVTGGREGHARSGDGRLDVRLTGVGETDGPDDGTNPEQLFAAGYAACFQSAMTVVGERHGIDTSESTVVGTVTLGRTADDGWGLAVTLRVSLPGSEPGATMRLIEETHQVCPYSRAIDGNVPVTLEVAP